jgi:uncharacterized protein YdeI (YjbR/CyaY-like superfamily)
MEAGLMAPAGLEKVKTAKLDGSWTNLDRMEEVKMSAELELAFKTHKQAMENFEAFSASVKKGIIWWVESAKRPGTKQKRIELTIAKVALNLHPVLDK